MRVPPQISVLPEIRDQFSQFIRGEAKTLDDPRVVYPGTTHTGRSKETLLNLLWCCTDPLPTIDRELLGLPPGATYGDGARAFTRLVWPDCAAEIAAVIEANVAAAFDRVGE